MSAPITYEDLINKPSSHKVVLAWIEPLQRAVTWTLDSGAIYKRSTVGAFQTFFIVDVILDTTSLVQAVDTNLDPGEWFFDAENGEVFIRMLDDSNPRESFISLKLRLFFSDGPFVATHDLTDTGIEVEYEGLIQNDPQFKKEIDPATQLGIALESDGTLTLENSHGAFDPIFDKLFWVNKKVIIYSWFPETPISEKRKLFEGVTDDKSFSPSAISFKVKDQILNLRSPVKLSTFSLADGKISDDIVGTPKRRLYGKVKGALTTSLDQVLDGYTLTGVLTGIAGNTNISGVGTNFLEELAPKDEVVIQLAKNTVTLSVDKVNSDTSFDVAFGISQTFIIQPALNTPEIPSRTFNRTHHLAGHKLRSPSTTITEVIQQNRLRVGSTDDLFAADTIKVAGVSRVIKRISNDVIILTQSLPAPTLGQTVTKTPVDKVTFNKLEMVIDRDFTVDNGAEAKILFNSLAEFNQAQIINVVSTSVTFTNGSRSVSGIGTSFLTDFRPRDWIRSDDITHQTFYEVLQVNANNSLDIRVAYAGANNTGKATKKNVVLIGDDSKVIVDCVGKENASGEWVKTASDVIKDLMLNDAELVDLDLDSFAQAKEDAPFIMSLKIPLDKTSRAPIIRDVVNIVNKSVFGSLISKSDFQIAYNVINSEKPADLLELQDDDIVDDPVYRGKTKVYKTINGNYNHFDADIFSLEQGSSPEEFTNEFVEKLIGTKDSLAVDIYLFNQNDAETIVQRYALFYSLNQSLIQVRAKMNLTLKNLGEKLFVNLDRLFFRFGASASRRKIGVITKIVKSGTNTDVTFTDLANIFDRVATIADDASLDFTNALDAEKIRNGYIVDNTTELPDSAATTDDEWNSNIIG